MQEKERCLIDVLNHMYQYVDSYNGSIRWQCCLCGKDTEEIEDFAG